MFKDRTDYDTTAARRAVRSALFRSGLNGKLGPWWWKPVTQAPYLRTVVERPTVMFAGMPTAFDNHAFTRHAERSVVKWGTYRETIACADKVVVEPNRCQVLGPDDRLVSSFDPHRCLPVYPSAWQYRRRRIAHRLDEAIVFDGSAGRNLYHFLTESLMGLAWLQEEPDLLPADLPLIINRRIADHVFFQHLRRRSAWFDQRPWLVLEPGQFAEVGRAYHVRAAPFREGLWQRIRAWYGQVSKPQGRRLFVSRDASLYGRGLSNEAQVAGMLAEHGFELFYAEHHRLEEQQAAFEEAEWLVGLHGMALVHQFFMPFGRGGLLELMPRNRLQLEYGWTSWMCRRQAYDVLVGSDLDRAVTYTVDPVELARKLEKMLTLRPEQQLFGSTTLPRPLP